MYTFCSFFQEYKNRALIIKTSLMEFIVNEPTCFAKLKLRYIMKSLSDLMQKKFLHLKSKLLDCINSNVERVFPESYSKVIPSFAISAAFNCALGSFKTRFWKIDILTKYLMFHCDILFFVSCSIN